MDRRGWNERYRSQELLWSAEPNRFVVAETADLPPGRALDVAAGEGRNALWLAERGWQVTAVDYSDVAVERAREIAARKGLDVTAVVADVTAEAPEAAAYDLVLIAYLQLPEPDRSAAMERAAAAVAPGGRLVIVAHDRSNLDGGHGGPQDPAVLATPDEVASQLAGLGLEVTKAELVERVVETQDGSRVAVDHVVTARRPGRETG